MKRRWMEFMSGRYGADQLSRFTLAVSLVLLVANIFTNLRIVYLAALVVLAWCYYRMFSRNIAKRSAENQKYLNAVWKLKVRFGKFRNRVVQSKNYHIYKCPSCGQKIRIPRGKGKICITCPKCRTEFQKKS